MELVYLKTKKDKKQFMNFRAKLYKGDENYVCTENFVLKDILYGQTEFAKSCLALPVAVKDSVGFVAQAILIYSKKLEYVQVGFFDALKNQNQAVSLILNESKKLMEKVNANGVCVGLNGHISYGVGILNSGFEDKNSFDSVYNKDYYDDYFKFGRKQTLSTYKCKFAFAIKNMPTFKVDGARVRKCDTKNFKSEMMLMQSLCEKTIAKTDLYFPTEKLHFYELTRDLQPFLKPENLLFAEDENGNALGFLFSHPDFNQVLKGGKEYSLLKIGFDFLFKKKRIDTVKINAIGSLSTKATYSLLLEFMKINQGRYENLETTFIWDNNLPSKMLAERVFKKARRRYGVYYFYEV